MNRTATHIRILACLHLLVSGGLLCMGLWLMVSSAADPTYSRTVLPWVAGLFFWLGLFVLVPSFVGGLGLLRQARWGRVVILIVSVELLLAIPIGTIVGAYGLWVLLQRDAESLLTGPTRQAPPPAPRPAAPPRTASSAPAPAHAAWTAEQTSCAHLRPIEDAMRAAGIPIAARAGRAHAGCRVHAPAFDRRFGSPWPVAYSEYFQPERYFEDNPTARLHCASCNASLYTLHPMECSTRTPWFPEAPVPLTAVQDRSAETRGSVAALSYSPAGSFAAAATSGPDCTPEIMLWETDQPGAVRRILTSGAIRSLAWSRDQQVLFGGRGAPWPGGPGSPGPCIFAFDANTGSELFRFGDELYGVDGIALSPDGRSLLLSGMLGETRAAGSALELWEIASGRRLARVAQFEGDSNGWLSHFTDVAFTPDGSLLLAGCNRVLTRTFDSRRPHLEEPWWVTRGVRTWVTAGGAEVELVKHTSRVTTLSLSADGSRLFVAGERLGVWNLIDRTLLWDRANFVSSAAAADPDCRYVARGTGHRLDNHGPYENTAVELYDGHTGAFLTLGEHRTTPIALAFQARSGVLAAGCCAGELRIWRVPGTV